MLAKVYSAFPVGLQAILVEIEVEVEPGLRTFTIIGLPDEAVREAENRVSSALKAAGFQAPSQMNKKITVNLAPADVKKQGAYFDVAIALGFLRASGQLSPPFAPALYVGELSLDGHIRPVTGILSVAMLAKEYRFEKIVLPEGNRYEAALIKDVRCVIAGRLLDALELEALPKDSPAKPVSSPIVFAPGISEYDMSDIKGQEVSKYALEIAAAGGHHLFMIGPPGTGKSILAKAFPSLLPPLDNTEGMEVARVASSLEPLAHFVKNDQLSLARPFRAPHHGASAQSILGGGSPLKPGEITLAHRGILFLDEFPEFRRDVLEGLRQPLEDACITVTRSNQRLNFPAQFQLLAAANPCPCGFRNDERQPCACTPGTLGRYERKLSGPIMDRMDMFIWVPRLEAKEIFQESSGQESSAAIRERVTKARDLQYQRFGRPKTNAQMSVQEVKKFCIIDKESIAFLALAIDRFNLSMRAYHKILKVARTIADMSSESTINQDHVAQALRYRRPSLAL